MQFLILGPIEVRAEGGTAVELGARRERAVLAALLVRAGRTVSVERLADDVWGEDLPRYPIRTVRTYVSRLRGAIGRDRLQARGTGYQLVADPHELDRHHVEVLAERARTQLGAGDSAAAGATLREALATWRGDPLADLDDVPLVAWARPQLDELRLSLLEDRIDADIGAGRHEQIVGELALLVERHPLRERFRAGHMLALYRTGRHAEALASFEQARRCLRDELGVDPSPALLDLHGRILRRDPGLAGPATVSRALPAGAPAAAGTPPSHLPRPLASFVGREEELGDLDTLLDDHRFLSIVGPGGSGKTRLAVELAGRRAHRQGVDAFFVGLASVADAGEVASVLAESVGLVDVGDQPLGPLRQALAGREVLLVVDNCEHVRRGVATVLGTVLADCPDVRVVTTSREPIGADGEHTWWLSPLPLPPPSGVVGVAKLTDYDAIRLFEDRARAADATFTLDADVADAVVRICRKAAGIPLALELVASRVRTLSCREIADRLDRSIGLMRSDAPTVEERHRTMEGTLDWSWHRLSDPEQRVLRRLAVFRAPVPLEAVEAVAAVGDGGAPFDVLEVVEDLVARSLVVATRHTDEATFHLLEPVRLYAWSRLVGEPDRIAVEAAQAGWWLQSLRSASQQLRRDTNGPPTLDRLHRAMDDLRAVLDRALSAREAALAQQLVSAAYSFWWTTGRMREGMRWAQRALDLPGSPAPVRASAVAALSGMEAHHQLLDAARDHAQEALEHLTGPPDEVEGQASWVDATLSLAYVEVMDGDVDEGERLAEEVVRHGRKHDAGWALGSALVLTAKAMARHGRFDEAVARYGQAMADARRRGSRIGVIATRYHLGMLELRCGNHEEARRHLEALLEDKEQSGIDPFGWAGSHLDELRALTDACWGQGDLRSARAYAERGMAAAADVGSTDDRARFRDLLDDLGEPSRT